MAMVKVDARALAELQGQAAALKSVMSHISEALDTIEGTMDEVIGSVEDDDEEEDLEFEIVELKNQVLALQQEVKTLTLAKEKL